ncbi:MAG: hypothetical protein HYV04_21455 [Deltaproteobacteria bacterium]|nr:hypothetical protein [Deltaproteobacteria bacterium]
MTARRALYFGLIVAVTACRETVTEVRDVIRTDTLLVTDTVVRSDTIRPTRIWYRPVLVAEGHGGISGQLTGITSDSVGILIAEQRGSIERLDGRQVFDLSPYLPKPATYFGGLFNILYHAGRLFAFYSTTDSLAVISEVLRDGSVRPLLRSAKYRVQHYGGGLAAQGDYLYVALGDGQHFQGEGETTGLYGRLLRLDLRTGAMDTIAKGLRSPWRIALQNDSIWIADTGAFLWEEVNRVSVNDRRVHLGWPHMEGNFCRVDDCSSYQRPVYTYPTAAFGCSAIIGGYVWRGRYWFTDFCEAWFRSIGEDGVRHEFDLAGEVTGFGLVGEDLYVIGFQQGRVWKVEEVR